MPPRLLPRILVCSAILQLPLHAADLLGYWSFNNASVPGAEQSGNSPNLTLTVQANLTADAGGHTGQPGDRGLDLGTHNNGGYARTPTGAHFNAAHTGNEYSVVLWQYNRQVADTSSFWFQAPQSGGTQRGIQAHIPWGNGTIFYDQSGCCGGSERLTVGGQITLNTWQHFVFQRDAAGNRQIWVDGSLVASSGGAAPLEPLDGVVTIGAEGGSGNSLNGIIDDFAIFDAPLTAQEIATLAGGASPTSLILDSDNDGMPDSYELANGLNHLVDDANDDADSDGLNNIGEFNAGTDPQDSDSDDDTLTDGVEVTNGTDPLDADTDDDGLTDAEEVTAGTNPFNRDTDSDSVDDSQELSIGTDPLDPDSDDDGSNDGLELAEGTDPLDDTSFPDSVAFFAPANARFVEVVKNNTTETQLHIGEVEVFAFGTAPDEADADGTSQNDLVQAGSPSVEIPPTTTTLEHGNPATVFDGDLESGAGIWSTDNGLGIEPRYMLDLGATHGIGDIRIWGRNDTCCPNRLENFTVNLYADNGSGQPGDLVNSALFPSVAPSATLGPAELTLALPDPGVTSFTVDKPFIPVGEPILLSWEVNTSATKVEIDQGVGDVTALTDAQGIGSILLNPGPNADATYRLVVTRSVGKSASSLTVQVTDQPIIFDFDVDQTVIAPGGSAELTWSTANVTGLTLNGANVMGQTSLTVSPPVTTEYVLIATNAQGTTQETQRVRVVLPGEPLISEFMADNRGDVTVDEDGDSSDWIELCNPEGTPKSLNGYYLTDDPLNLTKWRIPNITLAANSYLVLFASGKDRDNPANDLHTNFSLQDGGEYLALVKPDGFTIVMDFWPEFPNQRTEVSYGFDQGNVNEGFFISPTPGAENGATFTGFVGDTTFSKDRGFYTSPFTLEITTSEPGAEIRYTLDGTKPTQTTGLVYTGPITISQTTIVRAAGFKDDYVPTNVDTQTYLFTADVIAQPTMRTSITQDPVYGPQMDASLRSIPTLSLVFPGDIERTEKEASVEFINFEAGDEQHDVGMSRFGNYVTNFPKRSFRLAFRSEYGAGKLRFPIFDGHDYAIDPADEFDQLDIRSGNHDMVSRGAYMSNRFTDDTMMDMGNIAPHGRHIHVYINGVYWGQYHMRERWSAAMLAEYHPGKKEDFESINANNTGNNFLTGTPSDGTGQYWNATQALVNGPDPFLNSGSHLDIANVIDFMLLWVSGNSESEFRSGGSVPMGVPFKFFMKDADGFLRSPSHSVTHQGPISAMARFAADAHPDYKILLADRIHKHYFNDGAFTPAKNIARLQTRVNDISTAFFAEAARWNYRTPSSWQSYQNNLINSHFPGLTATMITRFRNAGMYPNVDAPSFNQHGGTVPAGFNLTMNAPAGTIYYTLDGSDPRVSESSNGGGNPPAVLVAENASKRVHVPANATDQFTDGGGNAWNEVGFNDGSWTQGTGGVGYENNSGYGPYFNFNVGGAMSGQRTSCLIRIPFTIGAGGLDDIDALELKVRYDDAFVAYLNGVEVDRRLFNGVPDGDSGASSGHSDSAAIVFETLDISDHLGELVVGNNVLAIHGLNHGVGSSDFLISAELQGRDTPTVTVELSPSAVEYTGAVPITTTTMVKSRVFDGSSWSALNEATFVVDSSGLVVSEFMYNPSSATEAEIAAGFNDSEDFEYFELLNTGSNTIDLTGIKLDDGITFDFATGAITQLGPGQRVLVVEDIAAFEFRYGTGHPVAGQYTGKLSDGGEFVRISNVLETSLIEFTYDDIAPWPTAADGGGSSLVLIDPNSGPDHNAATSWAASQVPGGTPGAADVLTFDYATWAAVHGVGAPNEDPDGDGLSNFDEFVRGSSPTQLSSEIDYQSQIQMLDVGGQVDSYLTYTYTYSLAADVDRHVEVTGDLANWMSGPANVVLIGTVYHGDGTATATWRSASPVADERLFMRAVFSTP